MNEKRPYFSIVMLAKDKSKFLYESALSVLKYPYSELVLVEPGSTDNSREISEEIKAQFPTRVKLVTNLDHSPPQGLNNGLNQVSGYVIGFLNADDEYLPGGLKRVRNCFETNSEVDIFLGSGLVHNLETGLLRYHLSTRITRYRFALSVLGGYVMFQPAIFYRFDSLPNLKFNENNLYCWDAEMLGFCLEQGLHVRNDSYPISLFRIYDESITGSGKFRKEEVQWLHENFLKTMRRQIRPSDHFNAFLLKMLRRALTVRALFGLVVR